MDNFWERQRVSAVPDEKEKCGSDHPRLPVCDLNQLSVHVNVLHWRPTQPRYKFYELNLHSKRIKAVCDISLFHLFRNFFVD